MGHLLSSLKSLIKPQQCEIDNIVFRLHYRVTVISLMAFCLIGQAKHYFGNHIECIAKSDKRVIETYCWIHPTWSVNNSFYEPVGSVVPYPGISNSAAESSAKIYHSYYQWVYFVLYFEAILFYVPRYFWKASESGLTNNLILGLDSPIINKDTKLTNLKILVNYLLSNFQNHRMLYISHIIAEVFNLFNVFLNIYILDRFLNRQFYYYGWNVAKFYWNYKSNDEPIIVDPMIKVFPILTQCTFHDFGPSGDIQKKDYICLLANNVMNKYIFLILWFWYYFLIIVSVLALVYRISVLVFPIFRRIVLQLRCNFLNYMALANVIQHCSASDWFLIDLLAKNMDAVHFNDLLVELNKGLKPKRNHIV